MNAETTHEYTNELLKYIIEHTRSSIAVHDKEMNYIYVSNRYYDDMRISDKNIIGRNHYEVFPDLPEHIMEAHRRALNGEVINAEADKMYWKDGRIDWANWQCRPWYSTDGSISGIIIYVEVITQRKLAEEALVYAKEKAEESDRLKTAFLNNISHEIRTPMNAIVGFSALLSDPFLPEESRASYIEVIMQSSSHLLAIITDIVDISNIEAGIVKLSDDKVKINELLDRMEDMFSLRVDISRITLRTKTSLPDEESEIITDITKLTQVLTNLLSNAFKFTTAGIIEFGYRHKKHNIEFFVSDTGIGIPANKLANIFDRFYQIDHELSRVHEGTGLGLSISKAYVELMGGSIWAESEQGKGSVFHFTIPRKKAPADSL